MNYDRIILELINRVACLENEIAILKQNSGKDIDNIDFKINSANIKPNGKDTTKYIFNGKKFGKGRLALAIVKKYIEDNPLTTAEQLSAVFDKSLQGSLGVVETLHNAQSGCSDFQRRFFIKDDELIKTATDTCVVCSQWGKENIKNIVYRAKQLGFDITIVK